MSGISRTTSTDRTRSGLRRGEEQFVRELRLRRRRSRVPWVYLVYHCQEPEPFGTFEPFGAFETFF